ncbi:MAG TPA: glycerophosphoryl diester phosphodiesterase [Gammaproteobacteria bacterium]|nr:glycerophosphoryl diester phosphodiesterase [Gammaproteobacteria bacterium]|tara:strand:+ start:97 stop:798 length:702 start_codon:yes stop_codon:yes gene_type:complete
MWVIGHRGAAGTAPENTLLSITNALNCGVDWIEIDVRMIDNSIIVVHEESLDRTTNGSRSAYGYGLAKLRTLDSGNGEKIPLLTEVLSLIDAKAGINIEIKQHGFIQEILKLARVFTKHQPDWRNRIMFSSFIPEVMSDLKELDLSGCVVGSLSKDTAEDPIRLATDLGAYSVNISFEHLSESLVEGAHKNGLKVLVYTVNDPVAIERCIELSVDGIFTDFPERTIATYRARS